MLRAVRRECPQCHVTLTRYQWSQLWWVSSGLSGRLVQPCPECGTMLRLSAMRLISLFGALGLIGTSVALISSRSPELLIAALVCALVMLGGVMGTRVEKVRKPAEVEPLPEPPAR